MIHFPISRLSLGLRLPIVRPGTSWWGLPNISGCFGLCDVYLLHHFCGRQKVGYMGVRFGALVFSVGLMLAGGAQAAPLPAVSGWSGYFLPFVGHVSTDSQFNTDADNAQTDSLHARGRDSGRTRVLPLGLVSYTFAPQRAQVYFGIPPQNVAEGFFQVELGVRHQLANGVGLRAAWLPLASLDNETWSDPFVSGRPRQTSDQQARGAKLAVEDLFGGMALRYEWLRRTVDEERSGEALGLDWASRELLRRDARAHRYTLEYAWRVAPGLTLLPALRYERERADGAALSFDGWRPQMTLFWRGGPHQASVSVFHESRRYDAPHPVYGQTRDDRGYGVVLGYGHREPFHLKNWRADVYLVGARDDSNLDFYDRRSLIAAVGVGYSF